jgi:hypothetical protein
LCCFYCAFFLIIFAAVCTDQYYFSESLIASFRLCSSPQFFE